MNLREASVTHQFIDLFSMINQSQYTWADQKQNFSVDPTDKLRWKANTLLVNYAVEIWMKGAKNIADLIKGWKSLQNILTYFNIYFNNILFRIYLCQSWYYCIRTAGCFSQILREGRLSVLTCWVRNRKKLELYWKLLNSLLLNVFFKKKDVTIFLC